MISTVQTHHVSNSRPLSYLDELAAPPIPQQQPSTTTYSCYLLPPESLTALSMHLLMVHGAIARHRYMYRKMPRNAYVSEKFRGKFFDDLALISGQVVTEQKQAYAYPFVCGGIDQLVYIHPDRCLPDFLREVREMGLPSNAIICVH